jgi:hypothetical protein
MAEADRKLADDVINTKVLALLREVIQRSCKQNKRDCVSRALLYFLQRVANTWVSIRTLRERSPGERMFMVDAGTLLRAMFDAYLQAEYIVADREKAIDRASDYLEFEHVERYKQVQRVLTHDNPLTRALKTSRRRPEGEKRINQEYERVRDRYAAGKKPGTPTGNRGRIRDQWYSGSLRDVAKSLGKESEYDLILGTFQGCVHSSAFAVQFGPPTSPDYVMHWASTITARVARVNVEYNGINLDEFNSMVLQKLCTAYFEGWTPPGEDTH